MINCKSCDRPRPKFALGPDDCDKCRPEHIRDANSKVKRKKNKGSAEDIKAKGRKLLLESDYRLNKYVIEEPDEAKLKLWKHWRRKVRNKIRTCKDGDSMVFPKDPNQRTK